MAYIRARQLIDLNRRCLDDLATAVLERETLTREDLDDIFDAHRLKRRLEPDRQARHGNNRRAHLHRDRHIQRRSDGDHVDQLYGRGAADRE